MSNEPALSNADLYDVPEGDISWIKIGDVALFISRGASGGPTVVAYHIKGDDREWMGEVEFVANQPLIVRTADRPMIHVMKR